MNNFIENQNWRYATKKFDATKKVSDADLAILKEAIRLSTSSYGLQPYKLIIVENSELRAKIQPAAWGQSQIVASWAAGATAATAVSLSSSKTNASSQGSLPRPSA